MTIAEAARLLERAGVPSPGHDARALAAYAEQTAVEFDRLVEQRAARVPLQHLLGTAAFRHLELAVGPGVFVPRPETELLVDEVLAALPATGGLVVDLCAGSGAIGLSVAVECDRAVVHLVESDALAVEWLRRNCAAVTAADRVCAHHADAATALPDLDGRVDVVVSNPPYLPDSDHDRVDPEVRDHDPPLALWGGRDGLDVVRLVVVAAARLLRPGGTFVVEHADDQGDVVPGLLFDAGFADVSDHHDLTGRPRFTTGRLP